MSDNPKPIIGYSDKLSVQPREKVKFMVSSDFPKYHADIVRLIHGLPLSPGPGWKEEQVHSIGDFDGKPQRIPRGSYIEVAENELFGVASFTIQAWVSPTTPKKGMQGVLASWSPNGGYALVIDDEGHLALLVKDREGKLGKVASAKVMTPPFWYFVAASFDAKSGKATLYQENTSTLAKDDSEVVENTLEVGKPNAPKSLLIGAYWGLENSQDIIMGHYNGKIDRPRLFSRALDRAEVTSLKGGIPAMAFQRDLVAAWDFSHAMNTAKVVDGSHHLLHGTAINSPKRAVTGYNWTGNEVDFKVCPQEYGAIHFHDDDLDDCKWEVGFEFAVPADLKSGVYAAKLSSSGKTDYVPFFVRPRKGTTTAKIAFLAPSLSYFAYGDFHNNDAVMFKDFKWPVREEDRYVLKEKLHSLYDHHSDGSGVCYYTRLKPNVTIRPDHMAAGVNAGKGGIRDFSEDLCLVDWLKVKGFQFDVITDEDLNAEGADLLSPYKVVLTGAHPEYWSGPMLDGLETYLNNGGRLMYLGGNGFYWVTSVDPERPYITEVRRWGGTQSWRSPPGEFYHSSTGELGGLWRNRGRAPQKLTGVGFSAQGFDTNSPYKRAAGSFDPRAAFIFEGIGKDELIGDHPNLEQGSGAAGDELDRADISLGTPEHTLILATAKGTFTDYYQAVVEEIDISGSGTGGSVSQMVRADMVYFEGPNNGAVFSVGSIAWMASLSHNNYVNNVSRIQENVLRKFAAD